MHSMDILTISISNPYIHSFIIEWNSLEISIPIDLYRCYGNQAFTEPQYMLKMSSHGKAVFVFFFVRKSFKS